jgi:hypothetical protein
MFWFFLFRYQKTESAIKATAEKTTSLFGGIGSAMSQKIGALKNTESFRSMEERVSSAVTTVKVNKVRYEIHFILYVEWIAFIMLTI